jgi:glycosyltransferase involved in cell wall biosynthesis
MHYHPTVDVNLFVYNAEATIADAIESILSQTWPNIRLTVIDNGSTDRTADIAESYCDKIHWMELRRNRVNAGQIANCQRAFWYGDADFVMPKTADDLLAPDFIASVMNVLIQHPDCVMCHAAGIVFDGKGDVAVIYPENHRIHAVGASPIARSVEVMSHYTSAPSFWGIYRREAVNRLGRFRCAAGWDHSVLAELALYGEIRHVPELLFWRRDGGKDVGVLARACSEFAQRGIPLDDCFADVRWRTPLITTAYGHIETFAAARVDEAMRKDLILQAQRVFAMRWHPLMQREADRFQALLPQLVAEMKDREPMLALWSASQVYEAISAIQTMLPEHELSTGCGYPAGLHNPMQKDA